MAYQSSFPPIPIPETDLWSLIFRRDPKNVPFPETKGKPSSISPASMIPQTNSIPEIFTSAKTGVSYSLATVRQSAHEFGCGLKARWSWRKGEVLTLYTPNSIDTAATTMGTLWAGGIISPANPLYTVEELTRQLVDSGSKGLVTQLAHLPIAREAASRANLPESRIILLGEGRDNTGRVAHWSQMRSAKYTYVFSRTAIEPKKDLAFLVYSSGTTGLPKGVCLTHHNMVSNVLQFAFMEGRTFHPSGGHDGKGDRQLGVLPLFHIYGLMCGILGSLYLGLEIVLLERFEMEEALRTIEKYRCTFAYVPPPIILAFGKHPAVDGYDLSSLKMLHSGAAPLTRELTEAVWKRLGVPVKQGFGLSESGSVTHVQSWDEWGKFMGSVGKLVPNMEARIVDEEGEVVKDGEAGELWLKGPNIFVGYYKQPEKTGEALTSDGWFKTGDVFRRDKYGNYFCVDRLKELIKYSKSPHPTRLLLLMEANNNNQRVSRYHLLSWRAC